MKNFNKELSLEIEELESCEALDGEYAVGFGAIVVVAGAGIVYGAIAFT